MTTDFDRLVAEQLGVVRACDARHALGVGAVRHRITTGRWQKLCPFVLATFSGPPDVEQRRWAAFLYAGDGAVLSHATAAELGGLSGFDTPTIHVSIPHHRQMAAVDGIRIHRRRHLPEADVHPVATPPRTRVERAVLDTAMAAGTDAQACAILAAAVHQRLTTPGRLRSCLDRQRWACRRRVLTQAIDDIEGGARSLPEIQFVRALRAAGVRLPTQQAVRQRADGRYYLDAHWPDARLTVEIDGRGHLDPRAWAADLDRQNHLVLDGDRVLRFTSTDVRLRPAYVASTVAAALYQHQKVRKSVDQS